MAKTFCLIKDLNHFLDKEVSLKAWVYQLRSSKKIKFLVLRDGSGLVQCIFSENDCVKEVFDSVSDLNQEAAVELTGLVQKGRKEGELEILASSFKLISDSINYPITPKEHGVDYLMNHRHLWLRSKKQYAILKIRHEIIKAIRSFFDQSHFTLCDAPIFTPNACEGTSDLFKTDYFGQSVFLSQTGQLYLEALAMSFGKVYCLGPTFRAEKSKTRKHLIEFWMAEAEVAFSSMEESMDLSEKLVKHLVSQVLLNSKKELETLERDLSSLEKVTDSFERIHYLDACKIVEKKNKDFKKGDNLGALDEVILSEHFKKAVFVHHFPSKHKAFYMKEDEKDLDYSLSFDLIAPESYGEIIGGGQRKDDYESLLESLKKDKLKKEDFDWYLDLRKYGSVPHAGFGLGIERTVSWICGLSHVRESIPFPRMYGRFRP